MEKIGIIKLGARGDVIRTLSILPGIKKKFSDSKITWFTKKNIADLVELSDLIDSVKKVPCLPNEDFDVIYNLDLDEESTAISKSLSSKKRFGFKNESGYLTSYNLGAEDYLNTMFDDELKKLNNQTYQELIYKAAELDYDREFSGINLSEEDLKFGRDFVKTRNPQNKKIIGIHIGASPRWPSKTWHSSQVREFIKNSSLNGNLVILFGGPDEVENLEKISDSLKNENVMFLKNDPNNSNIEFASLLNQCDVVVCSDSFALHLAIALKKKTIALFFCTSPNEIEGYSFLTKVVSPRLYEFFPEKMDEYDEDLTKSISWKDVVGEVEKELSKQ